MKHRKNKIVSPLEAEELLARLPRPLVFTNGCFDVLHVGHVRLLAQAALLGESLAVGVNSDDSVKRLKGEKRPIFPLDARLEVLASLEAVDAVLPFAEDTPETLIALLRPDVLVKGGDWPVECIAGARTVLGYGGKVLSLDYHAGFSTTGILDKLKNDLLAKAPD